METTELERFRGLLDELRTDLRSQLGGLGADPDEESLEGGDFDSGFADSAQSTAERGKVLVLIDRLRSQLREVDRALAKMGKGTYSLCERCGQPISPERLEALPYSTLCVSCKQKESA
ncbi:MAG: TraR/DksA family transcriptional regulator [Actinomycetota bacterium]